MKRNFLIALVAAMLPCRFVIGDGTPNATEELNALVTKVRVRH